MSVFTYTPPFFIQIYSESTQNRKANEEKLVRQLRNNTMPCSFPAPTQERVCRKSSALTEPPSGSQV